MVGQGQASQSPPTALQALCHGSRPPRSCAAQEERKYKLHHRPGKRACQTRPVWHSPHAIWRLVVLQQAAHGARGGCGGWGVRVARRQHCSRMD